MILKIISGVLLLGVTFTAHAAERKVVYTYLPETERWPETTVSVEMPPKAHPSLFLNADDFSKLAQRGKDESLPWARRQYTSILKSADAALSRPLTVPDLPGEWSHHYVCKDCGIRLKQKDSSHGCRRCGKIYKGWPYDGVVASAAHMKNINDAQTLGLAHQLTSSTEYAERAREILLAYADRYTSFPLHDYKGTQLQQGARLFAQSLIEAIALIPLCWAYDLIYNAPGTTSEHRSRIEDQLLRPMARVIRRNDMDISNWQSWHNAAIAAAGFVLRDAGMVNNSIHGKSGLLYQLENSVLSDGFWYEGTASYHFYALSALEKQALMMKAAGMETYKEPKFRSLYAAPLEYTFPDGRFPAVNDSDPISIFSQAAHYEIASALFDDPRFANVAKRGKRNSLEAFLFGTTILPKDSGTRLRSQVFPSLGAVMLRQEQSTSPLAVHLDYGPHGGGHGHPDKLGIVLYANGHDAVPDAGRLPYGAPMHARWYKTTLAHNTVVIDGKNQSKAEGKLLYHDFNGSIKMATAACETAYKDITLTRSIALAPEYLLDVMAGDSSTTKTWDLAYHVRGNGEADMPLTDFQLPQNSHGYQVLENVQAADMNGEWQMDFEHKRGAVHLRQADTGPVKVIVANGLVDKAVTTCPVVLSRKVGPSPVWITLITPEGAAIQNFDVWQVRDGWEISINAGKGTDRFKISRASIKLTRSSRAGNQAGRR